MKNIILGLGVVMALASCQNVVLTKPGATQADYQSDMNQCDYEATGHTQATDYSYNTMIGQEFDRAQRKKDLILRCMKAKGWEPQSVRN